MAVAFKLYVTIDNKVVDVRRLHGVVSLAEVAQLVGGRCAVRWADDDGDMVTVGGQAEWEECVRLQTRSGNGTVKAYVHCDPHYVIPSVGTDAEAPPAVDAAEIKEHVTAQPSAEPADNGTNCPLIGKWGGTYNGQEFSYTIAQTEAGLYYRNHTLTIPLYPCGDENYPQPVSVAIRNPIYGGTADGNRAIWFEYAEGKLNSLYKCGDQLAAVQATAL
eukprot:TRINITY_DN4044_c0_g1_i1.p1 TRINITY_DN4044_c0_g1~~TRINITY_DN4044_c0_g1_i1.p1  ORF type:complete len:218 (+),score=68.78 TRINITY_DN4044_c0_g1_i1:385-1038(+)